MRYHTAYSELAFRIGDGALGEIAAPETLVAARLEPVLRNGKGAAVLDLHFRRDDRHAVVPLIIVDVAMVEARERDLLVWPESVRESKFDDFGIAQRVEPWIDEVFRARGMNREQWKIFGDAGDARAFDAARAAQFLGAAPLEEVARRAAPFVFGLRHARGRDVVVASRDAALGAAILARVARRVGIAAEDSVGCAWYQPSLGDAEPEVVFTDAAHRDADAARSGRVVIDLDAGAGGLAIAPAPFVPLDAMFDFTGTVRSDERAFSVTLRAQERQSPAPILAEADPVGGSAGRILFALRRGARRFGGADLDYAQWIASAMRDEGFVTGVVDDPNEIAVFAPDLIHAIGIADSAVVAGYRRAATSFGIPFVITPMYDAAAFGGYWGATVTPYCYRFMQDEATVARLLELMRLRRLAVNEVLAETPYHPTIADWGADVRSVLTSADLIYVTGDGEQQALVKIAERAGFVHVLPPIAPAVEPAPIDALVGPEPFVLLHAPIESTQNQIQAVRAAQIADLPLVIAGPVGDADYAALVRGFAGAQTVLVTEPDEATLEGLYRGAEVFMDVAWVGLGLTRAARAVSRGAALAITARMPAVDLGLGDFLSEVDPADVNSIAHGLGNAWYRRHEEPARFTEVREEFAARAAVREVTRRIVGGYAQALERRNSPAVR